MDPKLRPATERSLNGQTVLDEDEYTAALSHIIARDFFPSLVHLDATNDYLDALHSQDPSLIQASVRRLTQLGGTPYLSSSRLEETPFGPGPSETPLREQRRTRSKPHTELSLDEFQAQFTSEDNSSFTQILDDENRIKRDKWGWAWEAQKRVEQQRDKMIEAREKMLIEAPPAPGVREKFLIEKPFLAGLITDEQNLDNKPARKSEEKNHGEDQHKAQEEGQLIPFKDQDKDIEATVLAPKRDTRPAGVDGWKFKARNSLMFPPDADETPYHAPVRDLKGEAKDPRAIKYGNTRLPEQDHSTSASGSQSSPPSPTRSHIEAAIAGTPYQPKSPRINNFSLVPDVPSPTASELGPAAVKQLMTWGTLTATPRILSQSDEEIAPLKTPFHIPAMTNRERISHKLSSTASKNLRAKASLFGMNLGRTPGIASAKKSDMGPPGWTPRRSDVAGNLTPAAKRLLERTTGKASIRRADKSDQTPGWKPNTAGRNLHDVRWTPTPSSLFR